MTTKCGSLTLHTFCISGDQQTAASQLLFGLSKRMGEESVSLHQLILTEGSFHPK
jgi:hypothetical protein